jgi:hypothetical protein
MQPPVSTSDTTCTQPARRPRFIRLARHFGRTGRRWSCLAAIGVVYMAIVGGLAAPRRAEAQPPSAQSAPAPVTLSFLDPLKARLSVVATGAPSLTRTTVPEGDPRSDWVLPPGTFVIALPAQVTNLSSHPIYLKAYSGGLTGIGGEFDVPTATYRASLGQADLGGRSQGEVLPAYSCHLSDISIAGDCEIAFDGWIPGPWGDNTPHTLAPGASGPIVLQSGSVAENGLPIPINASFDLSQLHVFLRDPRDFPRNAGPCGDVTHGYRLFLGFHRFSCVPPLSLELTYPGEQQPALAASPSTAPLGPGDGDCRSSGVDSQAQSSISFASVKVGSSTDVEKSERAPDHTWWVNARSEDSAGLVFAPPGIQGGPLGRDIEASGSFTFGTAVDMRFQKGHQGQMQAEQVEALFKGALSGDPAAESAAANLATSSVAASYSDSGVDLNGTFGGEPGKIEVSASHPQGVLRYANGDFGIYSTFDGSGNVTSLSVLGLGVGTDAVQTTELDLTNQDVPHLWTTKTDVAVSGLTASELQGSADSVFSNIKNAEVSGSASASAGLTVSAQQEADLTTANNLSTARQLTNRLDAAPDQLPLDTGSIARSLSNSATNYLVVSKELTPVTAGVNVKFSDGLTYGFSYGMSVKNFEAIYAGKTLPGGQFQPWPECVPK